MIAHRSAEDMARSLVTYMADYKAVRSAVLAEFNTAPSLKSIAGMRAKYLRQKEFMKRGRKDGSGGACEHGTKTVGCDVHKETAKAADQLIAAIRREHPNIFANLGERAA